MDFGNLSCSEWQDVGQKGKNENETKQKYTNKEQGKETLKIEKSCSKYWKLTKKLSSNFFFSFL